MFPSFDWSGFIPELIATFIGAGVGFAAAMLWDRKKTEEEIKHTKNHMINAIIEELKVIQNELNDPNKPVDVKWDKASHEFLGGYVLMSTPAFESAVNSGNFSLLETSLQTELGDLYLTIQNCNFYTEQIVRFYTAPIYHTNLAEREANKLANLMNEKLSQLRQGIKQVLPKLESAKVSH